MRADVEDAATRLAAKLLFVVAAVGLAWTLASEVSLWLGWFALLLASAVVALPLTLRELGRIERERDARRSTSSPWTATTTTDE